MPEENSGPYCCPDAATPDSAQANTARENKAPARRRGAEKDRVNIFGQGIPSSPQSPLDFVLWRFDFLLLVVFIGAPVVAEAGSTGVAPTVFEAPDGFALLSSTEGLGEATTPVCAGCWLVFG